MDTRFEDKGYTTRYFEAPYGAFLTILKDGKIIKEVAVSLNHDGRLQVSNRDLRIGEAELL